MGNPKAKIQLIEFASMTSPYSAAFDEQGNDQLVNQYVRTGLVSFEFRNHTRDPFDVAVSLLARCGGPKHFFRITHELFAHPNQWLGKLLEISADELQAMQGLNSSQQFLVILEKTGLQEWAVAQGLTKAQTTACLSDDQALERLNQMRNAVALKYPDLSGVPSFAINGSLISEASWEVVEPKLKAAKGF